MIDEPFYYENLLNTLSNENETLKIFDSELKEPFIVQGKIKEKLQELLDDVLHYKILRERDLTRSKVNKKREEIEKERQAAIELEKRAIDFEKVLEETS